MTHLKTVIITYFSRCKISIKSCTRALALKFYIVLDTKNVGSWFNSDRNIHLNIAQNNAIRIFPLRTSLNRILAQHRQSNWLLKTCLWHREPQKIPQISIYPNLVLFGAVFLTKNTIYTLFWCFCALTTYSGYTSNKINKNGCGMFVWNLRKFLKFSLIALIVQRSGQVRFSTRKSQLHCSGQCSDERFVQNWI